jgi:hypothetical protein
MEQAREALMRNTQLVQSGKADVTAATNLALSLGDFDTAGELLMQVYREKDGTWIFPVWVRLPEQAPDSGPWQEFWRQPGVAELAEIRRGHGLNPQAPVFGEGSNQ